MSKYWGERPGILGPAEPLFFMPPSAFDRSVHSQTLPTTLFANNTQQSQCSLLQPLAPVTQLPSTMSQHGQKRDFSDAEYVNESLLVPQQGDPTFFGLSASLPMSTYTTKLSLPPQAPSKKLRQSTRDVQGGVMAIEHLPQASTSRVHRPVASSRSRPVHRSQTIPSQRGARLTGRYRSRRLPQQRKANVLMGSHASTNPYMSERPPSWNWINELHPSSTPMGMLGSYNDSFRFTWPTLDCQSNTVPGLHSMAQNPTQMRHTFAQSNFQTPVADSVMPYMTPNPPRASERVQAICKATSNSHDCNGPQTDDMARPNGFFVPRGIEFPGDGWGKTLSPPDETQSGDMDTGSTSQAERSLPDSILCSAFDVSLFENMPTFDHDFGFDFEVLSNNWGDGSTTVETEAAAQDQNHGTHGPMPDASPEYELAGLLQSVTSYLSFSGNDHSEDTTDEPASGVIAKSDSVGVGSMHHITSISDKNDSPHIGAEVRSPGDLDQHTANATTCLPNKHVSENVLNRSCGQRESLLYRPTFSEGPGSDTSVSRPSTTNSGSSASAPATVSSETSLMPSPADYGPSKFGTQIASATLDSSPTKTPVTYSSASTNLQNAIQGVRHPDIEKAEDDLEHGHTIAEIEYRCLADNIIEVHSDVQEWVNRRRSADADQPIATNFKMPRISPSESGGIRIYGRQVIWASEHSQLDAGQEKTLTPSEKETLRIIKQRVAQTQEQQLPVDERPAEWMEV